MLVLEVNSLPLPAVNMSHFDLVVELVFAVDHKGVFLVGL